MGFSVALCWEDGVESEQSGLGVLHSGEGASSWHVWQIDWAESDNTSTPLLPVFEGDLLASAGS